MFTMFSQIDPCWPLTSTKNNRLPVLHVLHVHTKYEICPSFPSGDIVYKVFTIWPLLTPNDLWPPPKRIGFLYSMWYTYILNMRSVQASLLEISCLKGFHNLTPNDLWPLPKTIGFLYSMWYTYILNMRSVQVSLLEISCLQGFHNLTPVDPKWPLTSTKKNRLLVLNVVHLHTKYEICPSFPSWDIVFTRFSQFDLLTPNDLWPPPKTIGFLYSMWYTYIPNMWFVQASLLEISCLQARRHGHTYTHTHTYKHTHAIMNAKVTIIIKTKNKPECTNALRFRWCNMSIVFMNLIYCIRWGCATRLVLVVLQ